MTTTATTTAGSTRESQPTWSLAFALRHVLRAAGGKTEVDELGAALALPWLFCAPKQWPPGCEGSLVARDMFLVPVARAFGMTLREIHPPAASRGLHGRGEFLQHFKASYHPLVARALEHGQAVLAWRGWGGNVEACWGVVTDTCTEGVGLVGVVETMALPDLPARRVVLASPPMQVHVVERVNPASPSARALIEMVLEHCRRIFDNEAGDDFGVVTGPAAFRSLAARLDQATGTDSSSTLAKECARQITLFVRDLDWGLGVFRRLLDQATPERGMVLAELLRLSEQLASALRRAGGEEGMTQTTSCEQPHGLLRNAIDHAERIALSIQALLRSTLSTV